MSISDFIYDVFDASSWLACMFVEDYRGVGLRFEVYLLPDRNLRERQRQKRCWGYFPFLLIMGPTGIFEYFEDQSKSGKITTDFVNSNTLETSLNLRTEK